MAQPGHATCLNTNPSLLSCNHWSAGNDGLMRANPFRANQTTAPPRSRVIAARLSTAGMVGASRPLVGSSNSTRGLSQSWGSGCDGRCQVPVVGGLTPNFATVPLDPNPPPGSSHEPLDLTLDLEHAHVNGRSQSPAAG